MDYPELRSHFLPRTGAGRLSVGSFLLLFLLAEPPFLFVVANRIEPWFLGVPFLYGYLTLVYFALIAVLLYAHRRGV